jgi:hypothetical protein
MSRPALIALVAVAAACGQKIGDPCVTSTDCAQDGSRTCDLHSVNGYCTIKGCDYGTCPSEAVCVRFFPGVDNASQCSTDMDCAADETCDSTHALCTPKQPCSQPADCARDEVCTASGLCAPGSIQQNYCMLTCSSDGDCRAGYECRTKDLRKFHGGEPVPNPSTPTTVPDQGFCASRRICSDDSDCTAKEFCSGDQHVCLPSM